MKKILVVKFGGSVLGDKESLDKIVDMLKNEVEKGFKFVIVVSALKGFTDYLLKTTNQFSPNIHSSNLDEILAMGEKISARIISASLSSRGLTPQVIDTESPYWPIITEEKHGDANPILDETRKLVKKNILPLIKNGKIPIICGFIGKSKSNRITTMGRGGSDTTAIILGNILKASEVILVKNVGGIYSADPSKVKGSIPIDTISAEEAYTLTAGGAKILQSKALKYKSEDLLIRIVSPQSDRLISEGTLITKGSIDYSIEVYDKPITMITVIGEKKSMLNSLPSLLFEIQRLKGEILSVTIGEKSLIIYLSNGSELIDSFHKLVLERDIGKGVSSFGNLSMIVIGGRGLETNPGVVQRFISPLANEGINLYGVVTISSSIMMFILNTETEKAITLLRRVLKEEHN